MNLGGPVLTAKVHIASAMKGKKTKLSLATLKHTP
jgi:hypothetical protein